jgi:hypothetical protein
MEAEADPREICESAGQMGFEVRQGDIRYCQICQLKF